MHAPLNHRIQSLLKTWGRIYEGVLKQLNQPRLISRCHPHITHFLLVNLSHFGLCTVAFISFHWETCAICIYQQILQDAGCLTETDREDDQ